MIGTKITITSELAQAVGELAKDHPDCSFTIAYDDEYPEQEWLVTADSGYGTCTWIINDETAERRLGGMGETADRPVGETA